MNDSLPSVLFLCTANSARSVLAEGLLKSLAGDRFRAFSAGSKPRGEIHPMALKTLARHGHDVAGLRSKSWDEFAGSDAPTLNYIITVCDNAAGETCPIWPGHPMTAHWGIADPALEGADEAELQAAFEQAYQRLQLRIGHFLDLPLAELSSQEVRLRLRAIGSQA